MPLPTKTVVALVTSNSASEETSTPATAVPPPPPERVFAIEIERSVTAPPLGVSAIRPTIVPELPAATFAAAGTGEPTATARFGAHAPIATRPESRVVPPTTPSPSA